MLKKQLYVTELEAANMKLEFKLKVAVDANVSLKEGYRMPSVQKLEGLEVNSLFQHYELVGVDSVDIFQIYTDQTLNAVALQNVEPISSCSNFESIYNSFLHILPYFILILPIKAKFIQI